MASWLKPLKDTRQEAFQFRGRALAGFLIITACLIGLGMRFAYLQIKAFYHWSWSSPSAISTEQPRSAVEAQPSAHTSAQVAQLDSTILNSITC